MDNYEIIKTAKTKLSILLAAFVVGGVIISIIGILILYDVYVLNPNLLPYIIGQYSLTNFIYFVFGLGGTGGGLSIILIAYVFRIKTNAQIDAAIAYSTSETGGTKQDNESKTGNFCENCGNTLKSTAKFCGSCGTSVS